MIFVAAILATVVVILLLTPFWFGPGGALQDSESVNSIERVERIRAAILKRYLDEEASVATGSISAREWKNRQQYLTNRYIDATRRLEYLQFMASQSAGKVQS